MIAICPYELPFGSSRSMEGRVYWKSSGSPRGRSHPIKWFNESINRKVLAILTEAYKPAPEWWRCCFQMFPVAPGDGWNWELRCHRNWLYSKIWKQMQAPEWQGDIIVIITRSSLFADNVFLGCSNARCLDLMCGASSQLRSRNSNTSLDKEGNAIRAVVLSR